MSIKRYTGGAWENVNSVKRYENGSWKEVNEVKAYKNGAWERVFPDEIQIEYCKLDLSEYSVSKQFRQLSEKELEISFHSTADSPLLFYFDFSQPILDVEFIFTSGYSPDDDFYALFFYNGREVKESCIEAGRGYVSVSGFADQIAVCGTTSVHEISQLRLEEHSFLMPADIVDWNFRIRSATNRLKWK